MHNNTSYDISEFPRDKILAQVAEASHLSPLGVCAVFAFIFSPSLPNLVFVPFAFLNIIYTVFFINQIYSIKNLLHIYFDFCKRYALFRLEEWTISDYVLPSAITAANYQIINSPRSRMRYQQSLGFNSQKKIRVLNVLRSKNKAIRPPQQLVAYFTSNGVGTNQDYIFIRGNPQQNSKPAQQFKILHELGHVNADSETLVLVTRLYFWSFGWVFLWILYNVPITAFSIASIVALVGILLTLGRNVVRYLKQASWLLMESAADNFAIMNLPTEQAQGLYERLVERGQMYDEKATTEMNSERIWQFHDSLQAAVMGETKQHRLSLSFIKRYGRFAVVILPLSMFGVASRPFSWDVLLSNIGIFCLFPLVSMLVLIAITRFLSKEVDKTIESMKKQNQTYNSKLLDAFEAQIRSLISTKRN